MNPVYLATARLMTRVAPWLFTDGVFALKGGTAINLFVRDLPRLSVDLDLVLVDHHLERAGAMALIDRSLRGAARTLGQRGFDIHIATSGTAGSTKLLVRRGPLQVKVEANTVLRGVVHPVRAMALTPRAREILAADIELPVVSLADLYGGKIIAALDRQHPRDLFDVMELRLHEGITPAIRRSAVVYLASHNRPMHEVLAPTLRDISYEFRSSFDGMTAAPVALTALLATRDSLAADFHAGLDVDERAFLSSLARNAPEWQRLGIDHLHRLPAIRWKLANLERLATSDPQKYRQQVDRLEGLFTVRRGNDGISP